MIYRGGPAPFLRASGLVLGLLWAVHGISVANPGADPFEKALKVLRENYIYPSQIKFQRNDRLETFLDRLKGGASLETSETFVSSPQEKTRVDIPFPSGILEYSREAWTPDNQVVLDNSLTHASGIILDLRNCRSDLLDLARELAFFYSPRPHPNPFYSIVQTSRLQSTQEPITPPAYTPTPAPQYSPGPLKPLVVLINEETSGAPELLAALLKQEGAVLVGTPTAGACGVFSQNVLEPHQVLRYATGDVTLSSGQTLLGHPLRPDIEVPVSPNVQTDLITKIEQGALLSLIVQPTSHPKMSEAALVRGENPIRDIPASSLLPTDATLPVKAAPVQSDECLLQGIACLETLIFNGRRLTVKPG